MSGHGIDDVADAGAFLARLTRLDPHAVVRLRSVEGRTALWARLPWDVLAARTLGGPGPGDATVSAAELLAELGRAGDDLPHRRDAAWRWPLPPAGARLVETVPATEVRRLAAAAAGTLRAATERGVGGRAVGERALRDALLDHVAMVVTGDPAGGRVEISQRLVQGVVRMGFLGPDPESATVQVRQTGRWIAMSAPYGVVWSLKVQQLAVQPIGPPPKG